MKEFITALRKHITNNPPNFGYADSVPTLLCEVHIEVNRMEDA